MRCFDSTIAFDPKHSRMGGASLIPIAVARNIEQIRPVQGSYAGAPEDFVEMIVGVTVSPGAPPAN
jgi:hypothetical protein